MHPIRSASVLALVLLSSALGCKDAVKASEQKAQENAAHLARVAEGDVAEIERGLPAGAQQLASLYANGADPAKDLSAARAGLRRIRAEVLDLTKAKSTFFALADTQGVAIRNDLEQDVMAGQNVLSIFPALKKAQQGSFVTATGLFPTAAPLNPPDRDWVAAAPIKSPEGQVLGLLLTGWTYRRFANHLQETLRHDLQEQLLAAKDTGKLPILYVGIFDTSGVYCAPLTPQVNEKALADLDLLAQTTSGAAHGTVSITDRDFGWAAVREPKLGENTGIALLRSEI